MKRSPYRLGYAAGWEAGRRGAGLFVREDAPPVLNEAKCALVHEFFDAGTVSAETRRKMIEAALAVKTEQLMRHVGALNIADEAKEAIRQAAATHNAERLAIICEENTEASNTGRQST